MRRNPVVGYQALWAVRAQIDGSSATGMVYARGGNDYLVYFPGRGEHYFDFRGVLTEQVARQKIERRFQATDINLTCVDAEAQNNNA